ncbi:MAG TPA: ABC transporter ATP-binding protein [Elusimicrobiales bacterium]|nr:ABC transporter ATP-binding protein [Elusimicrobiales bacterium]
MDRIIELESVSKSYTQGREQLLVLEEVDMHIRRGEFVALTGPSGSGKSTLLHLIGLLDDSFSGTLRVFGRGAGSLDEAERSALRRDKLGFVFQFDSLLPEFTVLENIDMPARLAGRPDPAGAMALLERFGLAEIAGKVPMEISGGEKQRAAILRGLRNSPELLIADEPTGNLDRHNAKIVLDDLRETGARGTAVLMVTHNEEAARCASRILRLEGGKLSEVPR